MTVLNTWLSGTAKGFESQTDGLVRCDGCFPPRVWVGDERTLLAAGWSFENFHDGPHLCPGCAASGLSGQMKRRGGPPNASPELPNLLIVGAAKCGTTSLHRYLSLHPEIFMSEPKELNFFIDPACAEQLDAYSAFFDGAYPVRGESSPYYLASPIAPGVPARISHHLDQVKLIVMVRDPIQRLVSHYVDDWAAQRELRPFQEAVVAAIDDPYNRYVALGRYATQLDAYDQYFSDSKILVIDQWNLFQQRKSTLRRIFEFLNVDEAFESPRFHEVANTGISKRRRGRLSQELRRRQATGWLRRLPILRQPTSALIAAAKVATSRPVKQPTIDRESIEVLRSIYRLEAKQIRERLESPLENWSV